MTGSLTEILQSSLPARQTDLASSAVLESSPIPGIAAGYHLAVNTDRYRTVTGHDLRQTGLVGQGERAESRPVEIFTAGL